MRAVNIAYVITDLETGGVPLHLYRLARHVTAAGHDVSVASLSPPGPVTAMLDEVGVETYACDAGGPRDIAAIGRLRRHLRACKPDLVHAFLFHANIACRYAVLRGDLPAKRLLCEIQTVEIERRWHLTVDRWTQRWCRCVVGNSPSVVEHLTTRGGLDRERVVLVHGGVDPGPVAAAKPAERSEFGLPDDEPLLLWAGRLDPIKGLDDLVSAVALVARSVPIQALFIGDGPERARLEKLVGRSGVANRIHFAGRRTDVACWLKAADLFAFPSLTEGLPNALLEAMAAGLPIVATDAPGNRDVVRDRQNGLLVPTHEPERLADAILKLLKDRSLSARLARAAAADANDVYHIRQTYQAYLSLYASLIE